MHIEIYNEYGEIYSDNTMKMKLVTMTYNEYSEISYNDIQWIMNMKLVTME